MIIKKFKGRTEAEATAMAKKEMGEGIVVMNAKEVKKKGFFAFFSKPMVEVTAALEEEPVKDKPATEAEKLSDFAAAVSSVAELQKKYEQQESIKLDNVKASTEPVPGGIAEKLDSIQTLIEQKLPYAQPAAEKTEASETKTSSAAVETPGAEQEKIEDKTREKPAAASGLNTFKELLRHTMSENEIRPEYVDCFLEEIDKLEKPDAPVDYVLSSIYQRMILKFGQANLIEYKEGICRAVFFVGPTGVGKTTTIAKLASKFKLVDRRKVALLTTDTYRIAAAEQLRVYASILELPFRVIYSNDELVAALNEFKDYDLILVDTAGHSQNNTEQREVMHSFIDAVPEAFEKEVYLVVSATTKYRDLIGIADTYAAITDYRLIFTKLDETSSLGNLLNVRMHTGAGMSYVTFGQNVPDDIQVFNPQQTVKQLLGGRKKE